MTTGRVPIFTAHNTCSRHADQNIDQQPATRGGFGRSSAPGLPRARARLPVRCARAAATAFSLSWPCARWTRLLAGHALCMDCMQAARGCLQNSVMPCIHARAGSQLASWQPDLWPASRIEDIQSISSPVNCFVYLT